MVQDEITLYEKAHARLSAYIRANELRESSVRDAVLVQACLLTQPFTAEQLRVACLEEHISKGTIYNALSIFVAAGVVREYDRKIGQTVTEYELVTSERSHLQMVCNKCGRRAYFSDKAIMRLVNERKYPNFTPRRFSLIVYGECKVCRRKLIKK